MFELTINDKVYQFNFGFGFRRELDPKITRKIDGVNGKVEHLGVQMAIAGLMDGDVEDVLTILDVANKDCGERLPRKDLETYIENPDTDFDALCADVLDFLKRANCTKKTVAKLEEVMAAEKAKQEANNA